MCQVLLNLVYCKHKFIAVLLRLSGTVSISALVVQIPFEQYKDSLLRHMMTSVFLCIVA